MSLSPKAQKLLEQARASKQIQERRREISSNPPRIAYNLPTGLEDAPVGDEHLALYLKAAIEGCCDEIADLPVGAQWSGMYAPTMRAFELAKAPWNTVYPLSQVEQVVRSAFRQMKLDPSRSDNSDTRWISETISKAKRESLPADFPLFLEEGSLMGWLDDVRDDGPEEEAPPSYITKAQQSSKKNWGTPRTAEYYVADQDAREEAKRIRAGRDFRPPLWLTSNEYLARPDNPLEWIIKGLHRKGFNTTITAMFKTGKTTLMLNLLRSLLDTEPFLGEHETAPLAGRVAYANFEVSESILKQDLSKLAVRNLSSLDVIELKGIHFDIMADNIADWFIASLQNRDIQVLILDPWSGIYYGDENDNSEIATLTKRLDWIKRESGVSDLFIPIHTGRKGEEGAEHARGGIKIDDWVDCRWIYSTDRESKLRYLAASGRDDIEQSEREVKYDDLTKHLSYTGFIGTRETRKGEKTRNEMLEFIEVNPGCNTRAILDACGNNRSALTILLKDGDIETRSGPRKSTLYYPIGTAPPSL